MRYRLAHPKLLFLIFLLILSGCGTAVGVHELLPTAQYFENDTGHSYQEIEVFKYGEKPSKPYVRIAAVAAHGNGYANDLLLQKKLQQEAAKVGADLVIIYQKEITADETVGSYYGGVYISDQIKRPHLYGIACKYSKVQIGIHLSEDGVIEYVKPNSAAEEAGLEVGHKILAINGVYFKSDSYVLAKEVHTRNPGDIVKLEIVTLNGDHITKDVVLKSTEL